MVGISLWLVMTSVPHFIETIQLICNANQVTGFYMMGSIGLNGLNYYRNNMMNGELGGTE